MLLHDSFLGSGVFWGQIFRFATSAICHRHCSFEEEDPHWLGRKSSGKATHEKGSWRIHTHLFISRWLVIIFSNVMFMTLYLCTLWRCRQVGGGKIGGHLSWNVYHLLQNQIQKHVKRDSLFSVESNNWLHWAAKVLLDCKDVLLLFNSPQC